MIKFYKQKNRFARGFTLVEALVAIAIFTTSILALTSVLTSGISDTTYTKKKMAATYLAQEGIECARNRRDTYVLYPDATHDWTHFVDNFNTIVAGCPAIDSDFSRTIELTSISADEVEIVSTVSWTQGSGSQSVAFSEHLFNWVQL
jgi:type II secretory pathway pseudopilin PulG